MDVEIVDSYVGRPRTNARERYLIPPLDLRFLSILYRPFIEQPMLPGYL